MANEKIEFLPVDVYSFLGRELVIRSNSPELLDHLKSIYNRFYLGCDDTPSTRQAAWEDTARPGMQIIDKRADSDELLIDDKHYLYRLSRVDGYSYYTSQNLKTHADDLAGFCDPLTLLQSSLLRTVDILATNHHLIHAGVVSWRNEGIVFPATSGLGKTTLVLKLVKGGCGFLSDEVACFDPDRGLVEPFPRKLNVRSDSLELLGLRLRDCAGDDSPKADTFEESLDIEEIVPGCLADQCKPRFIIFLRGFGDKPRLEFVSASNAAFRLLNPSIGPIDDPGSLLFRFAPLLNEAQCYNLVVGDLNETAELVMQLLDGKKPVDK